MQEARINREGRLRTRTWLPLTSTWRATSKLNTWDPTYGVIKEVNDYGDTTTSADNICTRTWYSYNTTKYLIDFPNREETVGLHCETPPTYPTDAVEDTRYFYDGATAHGTSPTRGNVTRTEEVVSYNGTTPNPIMTSTAGYDSYGRVTSEGDALERITTTEYTHGSNGLVTTVKETNPKLHVTTTTVDPALGEPVKVVDPNGKVTEASYDALGQLRKVWLPGRATTETPNAEYLYTIQAGAASYIETREFGPNGNQISTFEIYDGFLRPRQTQATAPDGKRAITDTAYDARGLKEKESIFYNSLSGPTGTLVSFADIDISRQYRFTYDGLERQTSEALWSKDTFHWQTITRYEGDRTATIPPTGGTTSQEIFDADGRVIERRLYTTRDMSGTFDATTYDYNDAGNLTTITDPVGNRWGYTYDMLGRRLTETDPDSGATTMTYDNAGQLLTSTDSRSKTLAYDYDRLGRQIGLYETSTSGPQLASWTYDTIAKGQLTDSTRYDSGNSYTSAVTGYDDNYRPLGTAVTIPAVEGALAGTYTTSTTYKVDGSPATVTYPEAAGMAAETVTYTYTDAGYLTTMIGTDTYLSGASYAYDGLPVQQVLGATGQRITLTNTYAAGSADFRRSRCTTKPPAGRRNSPRSTPTTPPATTPPSTKPAPTSLSPTSASNSTTCADSPKPGPPPAVLARPHPTRQQSVAPTRTGTPTAMTRPATAPRWSGTPQAETPPTSTPTPTAGTAQPHTVTRIDTSGPTGTGSVNYTYDPAGNTTTRPDGKGSTQTLTWDTESHPTKVTDVTTDTTYLYDADGNRTLRRESNGNAVLFLGATEVRKDGAGALSATRYYGTIAVRTDGTLTWIGTDHHGTGNIAINATTRETTRRRLDPFGRDRANPTTWPGEKGFVNGTQDPTGLTHLGAREYDPSVGRFISGDPLIDETDPQQMHGYAYASNNPTSFTDPDGKAVIGDHHGELRAYRKYTYKKRGGSYKRYRSGYSIRDWRAPTRNKIASKRAKVQKKAEAKKKREVSKKKSDACGFVCKAKRKAKAVGRAALGTAKSAWNSKYMRGAVDWWGKYGGYVSLAGTALCIVATAGACTAVAVGLAAASITARAYDYGRSKKTAGDQAMLAAGIGMDVAFALVPGARVPGRSLGNTPWNRFVAGSAFQTGGWTGTQLTPGGVLYNSIHDD